MENPDMQRAEANGTEARSDMSEAPLNRSKVPSDRSTTSSEMNKVPPNRSEAQSDMEEARRKIADIRKRAGRHSVEDGIGEMVAGIMFVLLGSFFLAQTIVTAVYGASPSVFGTDIGGIGLLALCLCAYPAQWFAQRLKRRLVAPRAGVAVPLKPVKGVRWIMIGAGAVVAIPISFLLGIVHQSRGEWYTTALGVFLGAFFLLVGVLYRLPRFLALAAISLSLGVTLFLLRPGETLSMAVFLILLGVALAVSGGLALRAFVRKNPVVETQTPTESGL